MTGMVSGTTPSQAPPPAQRLRNFCPSPKPFDLVQQGLALGGFRSPQRRRWQVTFGEEDVKVLLHNGQRRPQGAGGAAR
jgi:hypothetical protein